MKVWETVTPRDEPEPCGTSMTVNRRVARSRIGVANLVSTVDQGSAGQGVSPGADGASIVRPAADLVNNPGT
jgi:hypothetical protein